MIIFNCSLRIFYFEIAILRQITAENGIIVLLRGSGRRARRSHGWQRRQAVLSSWTHAVATRAIRQSPPGSTSLSRHRDRSLVAAPAPSQPSPRLTELLHISRSIGSSSFVASPVRSS
ncbi:hypothetical protein EVAR_76085_1 [Eumeta japonica]|uniref:Uncharacterized protein n=1 Tax=Eumeta variegata TaxID=151549 RepID=A0A4C1W4H5_EUMVA|nr:hypothetical protein EVAR_76085_1 [Eumeta japonica]